MKKYESVITIEDRERELTVYYQIVKKSCLAVLILANAYLFLFTPVPDEYWGSEIMVTNLILMITYIAIQVPLAINIRKLRDQLGDGI